MLYCTIYKKQTEFCLYFFVSEEYFTMKKTVYALLTVLLAAVLFAGCGKTEAVKATEKLISSIGAIDPESGEALGAAREAFDALTEEEQGKVKNLSKLEKAEAEYKSIVDFNNDIASIVEAAETSFSKENFNVNELIAKAEEIKTAYESMSNDRKAMVVDYDKIDASVEVLKSFVENAEIAAAQYVKAFNTVFAKEKYTVTAVYCIKQIRNETDEYHLFALTYKTAEEKEVTVYSHARCTTDVAAEAIAARPETFFAEKPVTDESNARECGNVELDIEAVLALLG